MKTNKVIVTKSGEKVYVMQFSEQEYEDIHSALGIAVSVVDTRYKDSPDFSRAIHRLKRQWTAWNKDVANRIKQKGQKK